MQRSSAVLVVFLLLCTLIHVQPFDHRRRMNLMENNEGSTSIPHGSKDDLNKNRFAGDEIGLLTPPSEERNHSLPYDPVEPNSILYILDFMNSPFVLWSVSAAYALVAVSMIVMMIVTRDIEGTHEEGKP